MKIAAVNTITNNINVARVPKQTLKNCDAKIQTQKTYTSENIRANFAPISFKGNIPEIRSAFIITKEENDLPLMQTKVNGSYIVDFDSQTEVIYGIDALNYLREKSEFSYDTQIIIPKKCEGEYITKEKTVPLKENSAVMINGGTNAKVRIKKGFPMIIVSKKDYDWYERYTKHAQTESIKAKFGELEYHNSHLYNGDFSPNMFLGSKFTSESYLNSLGINKWQSKNYLIYDIANKRDLMSDEDRAEFDKSKSLLDKLFSKGFISQKQDGYIRFNTFYNPTYQRELMKKEGFSDDEINITMPIFEQTRIVHGDSRFCRKGNANNFTAEEVEKLKKCGILHDNKKQTENIFWKETFASEENLRKRLSNEGFSQEEQSHIIEVWRNINNSGYDISGLKFIDKNAAVYNLNDKLNNWTLEKTNWVTNSTALTNESGKTPFIGTSLVQTDEERVFAMDELRKGEKLHKHPNNAEKRQTEIYMITSGAAALVVVRNGKPEVKILKEGDLAVIDAGVEHCINSVLGEYEQIVVQVPSAFQYGFDFKRETPEPDGYSKEAFTKEAQFALRESRKMNLI